MFFHLYCREQSVERDVEDWDDPYQEYNHTTPDPPYKETPLPVHQLTLPFEKIIFVDDEWGLTECLSKISKPGTTLGFDAEWRPTMCRVESNEKHYP
ncbi:hypothetical protein AC249_AIPGENE18433 [Exaiptasia diaphana]|nr:hypothetical protein AC249_AIPGENE18433 [Exaiptasia diaphana]